MRKVRTRMIAVGFSLLFASLACFNAVAYEFVPTDAEFNSWPMYCRARYVATNIGQGSVFAGQVDRATQTAAESAIGQPTFLHVHHYCAGLTHFSRARLESDPQRRRFLLDEARAEMLYSLRNDPKNGPLYSTMIVNLALVERERGDFESARRNLEEAIKADASDPKPYLGLAIVLRAEKDLRAARTILETGLAAAGPQSLELHYNLGLICFELQDYECALRHAEAAYAGGYPFPGLKNRLADRGLWQQ